VYNHVMAGPEAIVEWFRGSALRPFFAPLGDDMRRGFAADYCARIAKTYPPRLHGKALLRFPPLFILAGRWIFERTLRKRLLRCRVFHLYPHLGRDRAGIADILVVVDMIAALEIVEVAGE